MKKRAIITDTAAGLNKSYIEAHDIKALPMSVIIDGVSYREGVDLTTEEIYEKLSKSGEGAKTSQPSIGEFMKIYESLEASGEYDEIIAIHASSELTGTYQSSLAASKETNLKTVVIDSKIGSYPLKRMVEVAVESRERNESLEIVAERLEKMTKNAQLYILPASFSQLRKSGRVSASQSMLASLLNIQLQLQFEEGKVIIGEKVRTKKRLVKEVIKTLEKNVKEDAVKTISVLYAGKAHIADEWKEILHEHFPNLNYSYEPLVPVAGVHTGHGTVALGFIKGE